ncbi:DUF552 domain-containing protein [Modestobacter sp. I12A-02628]|uniref:Cell division protein SepF n=1 Tax=Goekera deserti TaxID=2497753 RepID=A0A7K3WAN8_9ACTN|nr:cell division protein SepF [Goekera deserti]MPQ99268.1 DUF552 domain-containing protein [Goekera deserti]NDI47603.1 cell division protein SepF [Goekera deserti]NDI47666.1 cell division protein SepF [Goekera deserti]NEL53414.1 cell division protein SepF [Goekera deserti]
MAGAMRKMGIYLGLVEDDERAGYDRYAARQGSYDEEPGYGRYAREAGYDDYDRDYPESEYTEEQVPVEEPVVERVREREPVAARRPAGSVRSLGLASSGAGSAGGSGGSTSVSSLASSAPVRLGGGGGMGGASAGLAMREPTVASAPPVLSPVPDPAPAPAPAAQPYRITTLHPRTYNEARTIGERFRDGSPVIMNLTEMSDADAKRLVDFAAGLSFGLRGSIERVTAKVFLISPQNIDVTAEDKARIREAGFFNQS